MPHLLATCPSTAGSAGLWLERQVRVGANLHRAVCVRGVAPMPQMPKQDRDAPHQQVDEDPFGGPFPISPRIPCIDHILPEAASTTSFQC